MFPRITAVLCALAACVLVVAAPAEAQAIHGVVRDETGAAMPGVTVEARAAGGAPRAPSGGPSYVASAFRRTVTDTSGDYTIDHLPAGAYRLTFALPNFATARRVVVVTAGASA